MMLSLRRATWWARALFVLCAGILAAKFLLPAILGKIDGGRDTTLDSFPVFITTNGGLLEVGKIRYRQTYRLKNVFVVLGREIPVCAEEASVTIDPNITYRVRLAKRWATEYRNKTLYVTAPALEPALPVAFDTSHFDDQLSKCWFMMSMDTRKDLLRSLSGTLEREAQALSRIDFAHDHGARDTVRQFIQKWLLTQTGNDLPQNTPIDVKFADE